MTKGSHHSMTYLVPRHCFMRLFRKRYARQNKDINRQWFAGVRCFDFHIRFHNGEACFANGLMSYDGDVNAVLDDLEKRATASRNKVYVVLTLEWPSTDGQSTRFIDFILDTMADHPCLLFNVQLSGVTIQKDFDVSSINFQDFV